MDTNEQCVWMEEEKMRVERRDCGVFNTLINIV